MAIRIEDLEAAGLSPEQILLVLKEGIARKREQQRIIKRNQRSRPPCPPDNEDMKKTAEANIQIHEQNQQSCPPCPPCPPDNEDTSEAKCPHTPINNISSTTFLDAKNHQYIGLRRQKFEEFWAAYPKRDGANPRKPAEKKFISACKAGADPDDIIEGARRYAAKLRSSDTFGTPFVAQAVTWLNQQRWTDYQPQSTGPPTNGKPHWWKPGMPTSEELREKWSKANAERREEIPSLATGGAGCGIPNGSLVRGHSSDGASDGVGELFPPPGVASKDV